MTTKKTTTKKTTSKKTPAATKTATTKTATTKRAPAKKPTVAPKTVTTASPSHDDIALRAYALFAARGFEHGHDVEDWQRAEAELTQGI